MERLQPRVLSFHPLHTDSLQYMITIPVPARWVFCPLTYHVRASRSLRVQRLSPCNHVVQHFSRGPNDEVTKADGLLGENVPLRNWFRVITSAFVLRTDEVGHLHAFNLKSFFFLLPRLPYYTGHLISAGHKSLFQKMAYRLIIHSSFRRFC